MWDPSPVDGQMPHVQRALTLNSVIYSVQKRNPRAQVHFACLHVQKWPTHPSGLGGPYPGSAKLKENKGSNMCVYICHFGEGRPERWRCIIESPSNLSL